MVGDSSTLPVLHFGHVSLSSLPSRRPLHLRDVLVMLGLIQNIVSVHKFTSDSNAL